MVTKPCPTLLSIYEIRLTRCGHHRSFTNFIVGVRFHRNVTVISNTRYRQNKGREFSITKVNAKKKIHKMQPKGGGSSGVLLGPNGHRRVLQNQFKLNLASIIIHRSGTINVQLDVRAVYVC